MGQAAQLIIYQAENGSLEGGVCLGLSRLAAGSRLSSTLCADGPPRGSRLPGHKDHRAREKSHTVTPKAPASEKPEEVSALDGPGGSGRTAALLWRSSREKGALSRVSEARETWFEGKEETGGFRLSAKGEQNYP